MYGTLSEERVVNAPASEAWKLYGTLELADLVRESVTSFVTKLDVVEGDGGVGTVLEVVTRTEANVDETISYLEKYAAIDNEKRCKVKELIKGGFLDMGFASYRVRLEVKDKEGCEDQCILKSTVEYEVREEAAGNNASSLVSMDLWVAIMHAAKERLEKSHTKGN